VFPTDSPVTSPKEPWIPRVRLLPSLLTGFAGSAFPRFQPSRQCFAQSGGRVGTIEELRLLDFHLGPLVFGLRPDTSVDSVYSLAFASESPRQRRDVSKPVASISGMLAEEKASYPIFPGNPLVPMPCSATPTRHPPLAIARWLFRPLTHAGRGPAVKLHIFEALSHGLGTRCLRFMPPSRTTMQDSLRRDGQSFTGGV